MRHSPERILVTWLITFSSVSIIYGLDSTIQSKPKSDLKPNLDPKLSKHIFIVR